MDTRVSWLSTTTCRGLGVTPEEFKDLYNREQSKVDSFLEEQPAGSSLLFYLADASKQPPPAPTEAAPPVEGAEGEATSPDDVALDIPKEGVQLWLAANCLPDKIGATSTMFAVKSIDGTIPTPDSADEVSAHALHIHRVSTVFV
jgi:hypothetical protein